MQNNKKKNRQRKRRGRRDWERVEKKEGTLIINATGHKPFKIYKIKKLLLTTSPFHFLFIFPYFYMGAIYLFEKDLK